MNGKLENGLRFYLILMENFNVRACSLVLHVAPWNGRVLDFASELDLHIRPNCYNIVCGAQNALLC